MEYTDRSFTQRKNPANTLLGPLLKGKVNDQIHVSQMFEDRKYTKIGLLCVIKFELKQVTRNNQTQKNRSKLKEVNLCIASC